MGGMISATLLAVFFVPVFYVVVMKVFGRRAPPSAADGPVVTGSEVTS
jgi:multidrug efflux pump